MTTSSGGDGWPLDGVLVTGVFATLTYPRQNVAPRIGAMSITGLRTLRPALCGLLEALSQTLPKGQVT